MPLKKKSNNKAADLKNNKTTETKPALSNTPTASDSAALYRFTQLQKQLEREEHQIKPSLIQQFTGNYERLTPEGKRNKEILAQEARKILKENPNIKTGLYSAEKKSTLKDYMESTGSIDLYHPKIKPKGVWMGYAPNNDYSNVKPTEKEIKQEVSIQKNKKPQPKKTSLINIDPRGKKGVYDPATNSVFGQLDKNVKYEQIGESLYKPITSIKKPVILQKEKPEVKISPVKQEVPARDMTPIGEVKLPTDASIKIERRGGKFAVDYFDVDEKSNLVPKTELFDTADEADSFVKARKEGGKFYGPNITRRGATEDEAAKRVASKSSYSQYRKIGTGKEK